MRRMLRMFAAASLLYGHSVTAQEVPPLELLVEKLSDDAAGCGIDERGIEAAARSAARYNRLNLQFNSDYLLYINVNVVNVQASCVVGVRVSIYKNEKLNFGGVAKYGRAVFCDAGGAGNFLRSNTDRVANFVKEGVDRCLAKL